MDDVYNATVKKCTNDYEILHFNTGISQIMICVNELYKADKLPKAMLEGLCKLLAPICPHLAQECYSLLGRPGLLEFTPWPTYDEDKISAKPVTYAVQVNGKLRAKVDFRKDASPEELETLKKDVLLLPELKPYLEGKEVVKVIAVLNRIVSVVVK